MNDYDNGYKAWLLKLSGQPVPEHEPTEAYARGYGDAKAEVGPERRRAVRDFGYTMRMFDAANVDSFTGEVKR